MTVPVMRTSLKVGSLSIPITEIYNNNDGYRRNELDPIILSPSQPKIHYKLKKKMDRNGSKPVADKKSLPQTSVTTSGSAGTMRCPHKIDKSDGTIADCQYVTNRLSNYRRHERDMHINPNVEECCNLRFLYRADFRLHVNENHSGGKAFQCLECPATFVRKALLNRHLSVHDPSRKNHKCEMCPYSTSHATNLQRHYRVHEQEIMSVNWEEDYQDEEVDTSIEEVADEHSFYEYSPLLYETFLNSTSPFKETEHFEAHTNESSRIEMFRKRKRQEDCDMKTQRASKVQRICKLEVVGTIPTDYVEGEQSLTNRQGLQLSNRYEAEKGLPTGSHIDCHGATPHQEENDGKPMYPSYVPGNLIPYYPNFSPFTNWHQVGAINSCNKFQALPSLDSALSATATNRGEHFFAASRLRPASPVWISTYDGDQPDIKPQFSQPEEDHTRPWLDDCACQYHLTELAPFKSDKT